MKKFNNEFIENVKIVLDFDNYQIEILHIAFFNGDPNWNVNMHFHHSFELHFIPEGRGTLYTEDNKYEILPKTYYVTGPQIKHRQISDSNEPMKEYGLNFKIKEKTKKVKETDLDQVIKLFFENGFWMGQDLFDSFEIFEKIYAEFENRYIGYYTSIKNMLSQLIINVARNFEAYKRDTYILPHDYNMDRAQIISIYIDSQYASANINELAKILYLSVRQTNREVQTVCKSSFQAAVLNKRINVAKSLLTSTSTSIVKIATDVGFSSSSYFCKVFKSQTGLTPSEYREESESLDGRD